MAIFQLKARDGSVELTVRARCMTCARNAAAESAGIEGPRMWRDPNRSTVTLIRKPAMSRPDGRTEIITRIEYGAT